MSNDESEISYPLIKGCRELTENDFSLEADAGDWHEANFIWSYYLTTVGNMDEIFGTNVETDENSDYINVYACVDFALEDVEDCLEIALWKEDGDIEYYNYQLSERERKILLVLILQHELNRRKKQLQEERVKLKVLLEGC